MQSVRNKRAISGRELRAKNDDVLRAQSVNKFAFTITCDTTSRFFVESSERFSYKLFCELRDRSLLSALSSITPQSKSSETGRYLYIGRFSVLCSMTGLQSNF